MAKTRWVCVFCKRIMRSISGGLEELKSNKLFYVLFEKKWRIQYSVFLSKCKGLHQKLISKVLGILVNTHLEDLPIMNVHWTFLLWIFNENLTIYLILLIYNSQLCRELVTESIEFYEPLLNCFTINSFSSFAAHISNIFNGFFSLRRYLRSFVKSVVKWNMENIADIVHGRDRLLT